MPRLQDNLPSTPQFRSAALNAANSLRIAFTWDYTNEGQDFWRRLQGRFERIGNAQSVISPMIIPEAIQPENPNNEYDSRAIREILNFINSFNWDSPVEGSDFWTWLHQRLAPLLRSAVYSRLSILARPRRATEGQQPPIDERQKNLGKKPRWYAPSSA